MSGPIIETIAVVGLTAKLVEAAEASKADPAVQVAALRSAAEVISQAITARTMQVHIYNLLRPQR